MPAQEASTKRRVTISTWLPWLAISVALVFFALHFFAGGGRNRLITDSYNYLSMSFGEPPGTPFNTRVAAPVIASVIASTTGASNHISFQILTFLAVIGSLVVLKQLLGEYGGSVQWQAAILLTLGCSLAATFGYVPVMADPLLLLLTCATILALKRDQVALAVVGAVLAALTKEYGLLLSLVASVVFYRRGRQKAAYLALILPVASFISVLSLPAGSSGHGFQSWRSFISAMFGFQLSFFQYRGPAEYPKYLYMWSWSAVWPCLVLAFAFTLSIWRRRSRMQDHEVGFLVMLAAVPVLLLGDWGRSLLIVVPLACVVATSHRLAKSTAFAGLVALGGLSTALARPFHSAPPPPSVLTLSMIAISVVSSILIGVKILRLRPSGSVESLQRSDDPTSEVLARKC